MNAELQTLQRWRGAGLLRALDLALAQLLHELDPQAPPGLLLAAALTAQLEGQGHVCVEGPQAAAALLAWAEPWAGELRAALPPQWPAPGWERSPLIQIDAAGDDTSPLVLHGGRLYLRRYWGCEARVAAQLLARAAPLPEPDAADARLWLDRLFPPQRGKAALDWQKAACALALTGRLTLITGGPGTGKTYTAARLLVLQQALHRGSQPLRVALAAPTGKAAARLRQAIELALAELRPTLTPELFGHDPTAAPGAARTLHALLGARAGTRRLRHDASNPLELDLLFVDEASMVHLEMMDALLDALPPRSRLVLLGDKDQLASVEAGAVLGELCAGAERGRYRPATLQQLKALAGITLPAAEAASPEEGPVLAQHTVMLRHSRRFGGAIGTLAAAVNRGDAAAVQAQLASPADAAVQCIAGAFDPGALQALVIDGRAGAAGCRACFELLRQRPTDAAAFDAWALQLLQAFDRLRVLCALREGPQGVAAVNTTIESALAAAGLLPPRRAEWYEGRPVMVTRNDAALGVFNGDVGLALKPPGAPSQALRVYFADGGALRSVSSSRLADVETAFALTVHKSQGSEFEHVLLLLPEQDSPVLTRELLYTALTRAKTAFTLVAPDAALVAAAVQRLTRRGSGLRTLLGS